MITLTTGPLYTDTCLHVDKWVVTVVNLSTCPIRVAIKLMAIHPPCTKVVACREICLDPCGSANITLKAPCDPIQAIFIEHDHGFCDAMFAIKGSQRVGCYGDEKPVICFDFKDLVHLDCKCPKDDGWFDKDHYENIYLASRHIEEEIGFDGDMDI